MRLLSQPLAALPLRYDVLFRTDEMRPFRVLQLQRR